MLVRRVVGLVLFVAIASTAVSQEYEIVVESCPGGQNVEWFSKVDGNWMESVSKSKASGLTAPKAMFKTAGSHGAARFVPDIPVEGVYEVFATYPDSGNAIGVIYHVHSAEGDKEITLDQRGRDDRAKPPANTWFSLGKYKFSKGKEGYVEIRDPQTGQGANPKEPNVRIYADAVKWVPVGFALPPQFTAKTGGAQQAPAGLPVTPIPTAPPQLASPQPTVSSGMPALPSGLQPEPPSALPAMTPAAQVSSLPAAPSQPGSAMPGLQVLSSGPSGAPSLPSLSSAVMPSQPSAPSLPALGEQGVSASGSSLPALASLSSPTSQTGPVPMNSPALPALGEAPAGGAPLSLPALTPPPVGTSIPEQAQSGQMNAAPPFSGNVTAPLPQLQPPPSVPPVVPAPPVGLPQPPDVPQPISVAPSQLGTAPAFAGSSGLTWVYDEGVAHGQAREHKKKVLLFFVADGNKVVEKYETEYFKHPAVQDALRQFILRKVNFALNTRAAYKVKVYGAGVLVVTDSFGERVGAITELPSSPEDLARQLQELATKN